jgi:DNA-directed RNA polymerase sigma subunit (sigma70/sigma32)
MDDESSEPTTADEWDSTNRELFTRREHLKSEVLNLSTGFQQEPTSELETQIRRSRRSLEDVTREIVEVNAGLVYEYVGKFTGASTTEHAEEYESAGMEGLVEAVDTFEVSKGNFSSWAFLAIRRAVLRAVRESEHAALSARDFDSRKPVLQAFAQLRQSSGDRTPSAADVAKAAGVSTEQVRRILSMDGIDETWGKKLAARPSVSEFSGPPLDPAAVDAAWSDLLWSKLRDVPVQEILVFCRHEGLDGWPPESFDEIGRWLGIGRERARRACGRVEAAIKVQGFEYPAELR